MIKRKKSIVGILTVAMSLSMVGINLDKAYAGEYSSVSMQNDSNFAVDGNGLTWLYHKYDDGTICLDGTYDIEYTADGQRAGMHGSRMKEVVEIPSVLDGYTVTGVRTIIGYENRHSANYGECGKNVKKVIIPSGVREIGHGAFDRCPNLTEMEIPASVNVIGECAFNDKWLDLHRDANGFVIVNGILVDGHKARGEVTIPSNVRCIGDGAFSNSFALNDRFEDYQNQNITKVTIPSNVKRIGKDAFLRCNLTEAVIEEGVEVIDDNAFAQCPKLKKAKVPSSVTELSTTAFNDDSLLAETSDSSDGLIISNGVLLRGQEASGDVTIPASVTEIQEGAFSGNENITSVKIPGSIKIIPDRAFSSCSNLKEITIENGVETIGVSAFEQDAISRINIPDSVTRIDDFAFSNCKNLSEITYNESASIGLSVFIGTPWLENAGGTGDFTIINGVLLKYKSNTKSEVVIPDGVKEIAGGAFSSGLENMNITSIKIPEGVTKIGKLAFCECRNLSDLYVPSTVKTIEYGAFDFCDNIKFSGPGAEFAQHEKDNKYPSGSNSSNDNSEKQNLSANQPVQESNVQSQNKIQPGWSLKDDHWYYGNSDGTMKTGWLDNGGNRYYFYGNGQMATGFIDLGDDAYYYLDESITSSIGIMRTGWQKIQGNWYYFNTSGDSGLIGMMKKGWQQIDGNWYYFYYGDGTMAHDTWIDGYYVNSNGAWV